MEVEFQWHWPKTRLKGQHTNMKVGSIFQFRLLHTFEHHTHQKILAIECSETGLISIMMSVNSQFNVII